jgi:hypothetical protein
MARGYICLYGEDKNIFRHYDSNKIGLYNGTNYLHNRGVCLLMASRYFMDNESPSQKQKEYLQIEIQKICIALGDTLLLMLKKYSHRYSDRRANFNLVVNSCILDDIMDMDLKKDITILYNWGIDLKLKPDFNSYSIEKLITLWFQVKEIFIKYFLWYEAKRMNKKILNLHNYWKAIQNNNEWVSLYFTYRKIVYNIKSVFNNGLLNYRLKHFYLFVLLGNIFYKDGNKYFIKTTIDIKLLNVDNIEGWKNMRDYYLTHYSHWK